MKQKYFFGFYLDYTKYKSFKCQKIFWKYNLEKYNTYKCITTHTTHMYNKYFYIMKHIKTTFTIKLIISNLD